jgi:hypothetical protein
MSNKGRFATAFAIATLLFASTVQAQNNCKSTDGGARPQCTKSGAATSATTIFSNLGSGSNLFNQSAGLAISGPSSGSGVQAAALPFTPTAGATLEGLEIPVGWVGGTNSVLVCIYSDNGGLPGSPVECVTAYNLYPFGVGWEWPICFWELPHPPYPWPCLCIFVVDWHPIVLVEGTPYWVVVYPDPLEPSFHGFWNENYENTVGPVALYNGSTWEIQTGIQPAVALYGK